MQGLLTIPRVSPILAYIEVIKWNEDEPLSECLLRKRFSPSSKYRVSSSTYQPGAHFPGTTREGLIFILAGECQYEFSDSKVTLREGTYARLPSGHYWFSAIGNNPVTTIDVWDLEQVIKEIDDSDT